MQDNCKHYTVSIPATHPRTSIESTLSSSDRLELVYNKFVYTGQARGNTRIYNVVAVHGTGMNKSIWNYYVDKLLEASEDTGNRFQLGSFIAIDAVSHGDSAVLNKDKLGPDFVWIDGSKDIIKVVEHEKATDAAFEKNPTILLGHSLGGHQALMAGFLSPLLFDSIIAIEPVLVRREKFTMQNTANLFKRLREVIKTEFSSEEEYDKWMTKRSFFVKFHPAILKEFVESEKLVSSSGVYAKTRKEQQLITYRNFVQASALGMPCLPFIHCPTLIIEGGQGTWNPPNWTSIFTQKMPDCAVEVVPEGTHLLHAEVPDKVLAVMIKFLNKRATAEAPQYIGKDPNVFLQKFEEKYNVLGSKL